MNGTINRNAFIETLAFFKYDVVTIDPNIKTAFGRGGAGNKAFVWGWVDHPNVPETVHPGFEPGQLDNLVQDIRDAFEVNENLLADPDDQEEIIEEYINLTQQRGRSGGGIIPE